MLQRSRADWVALCRTINGGWVPSTGKASVFDSGAEYVQKVVVPFELVRSGDHVLDVGCGNGRLAMGLHEFDDIHYIGIDVVRPAIRFCQRAFKPWPTHKFYYLDVRNSRYNRRGTMRAEEATLPVEAAWADVVIASSLFTHIGSVRAAARYLSEMKRATKVGGRIFTTWFRDPPNAVSVDEARVVRHESEIRALLADLEWLEDRGGTTPEHGDQWMVLARKR